MIPLALAAALPAAPDIVPLHDAVAACDREAMASLGKAELHRRALYAEGVYVEQRAILAERAALDAAAPAATFELHAPSPAGRASLETARAALAAARAALDARQARLDAAKTLEQAWRTAIEEMRADFLANCERKRG